MIFVLISFPCTWLWAIFPTRLVMTPSLIAVLLEARHGSSTSAIFPSFLDLKKDVILICSFTEVSCIFFPREFPLFIFLRASCGATTSHIKDHQRKNNEQHATSKKTEKRKNITNKKLKNNMRKTKKEN